MPTPGKYHQPNAAAFPPLLSVHHAVLVHSARLFGRDPSDDALLLVDGEIRAVGPSSVVVPEAVAAFGIAGQFTDAQLADPKALLRAMQGHQEELDAATSVGGLPWLRVIDGGRNSENDEVDGMLVCPGFIDAHVHLLDAGRRITAVSFRTAKSKEQFRELVQMATSIIEPGCWIIGGDWDDGALGGCYPDRSWVDDLTPDHPLLLARFDSHSAMANTLALQLAGIDLEKGEDVVGGVIERFETAVEGPTGTVYEAGSITGIVREAAIARVKLAMPPTDTAASMAIALSEAGRELVTHGITGVHSMTSLDFKNIGEIEFLEAAARNGQLPIRVACAVRADELEWAASHQQAVADHLSFAESVDAPVCGPGGLRYDASRWVRVLGVKTFLDGSLGSRTACFLEPFCDRGGCGVGMVAEEELRRIMGELDKAGLMLMSHAIGDAAVRRVLTAFEWYVTEGRPEELRGNPIQLRIEHCQHVSTPDLARIARIRDATGGMATVVASMQPTHADSDYAVVAAALGEQRATEGYRFRSLRDAGAQLAFGSDWMVMPPRPLDTIIAATRPPKPFSAAEAITVEEAIRAFTIDAAKAARWDDRFGRLDKGYAADLTILKRNIAAPSAAPVAAGEQLIAFTIVDGMVRYESGDPQHAPCALVTKATG